MREEHSIEPIRIAIAVGDPALADRLAELLAGVEGIELVASSDTADATIAARDETARRDASEREASELALTPREQEVLALLAEGASNKEIARRLGISAHTAKFHVGSLMGKLDAVTRTDALAHAVRLGVIEL